MTQSVHWLKMKEGVSKCWHILFFINEAPTFPSQGFVISKIFCIFDVILKLWQRYTLFLTYPTKQSFFRSESTKISRKMILYVS